ncbi:ATPase, T2SS/T4P/T4SS family [Brevundimonas sp. EYE_349]|uniref:ATPase, T2SS/T4P/T4SS family n=1 Tax=Brevundimonas sp. EYE_349 TaxID=2853455 RepID=UPI002005068E|nr:ATPase, T2SS/T4P/T4SS family [Brevundimonas sp. EYE_349]MCK6105462.1 Flp pilus assembly complex ATPase component TadA [Brevundimonas sp. EYE_349]
MSDVKTGAVSAMSSSRRRTQLEGFYRRYSPWLVARLRRRFGADTEDLVQEIWLRMEAIEADLDIRHPRAFLLKIAFNIGLSGDRQTRRRRQILDSAVPLGAVTCEPAQDAVVQIQEIVLALPQPLRDRIVVGEMRDGAAALETLKSWNTGHPGGLSTIHANSADDVLRRMEDLIAEVSSRTPRRAIAQAVDRIVHIRRTTAGRQVQAVLGVEPLGDDGYAISVLA